MSVNVQEGEEGINVVKPTSASISIETFRIIIQLQGTGWKMQGEHPGAGCGSMGIPGCCSKGSKACGNCSCHLSHLFSTSQPEWEFTNQQKMELEMSYFSQKILFLMN